MHVDAKITSKNQITLPRAVRDSLGVAPGGRVRFRIGEDGAVSVRKEAASVADLRGIIPYDGPPMTTADILALIDEGRDVRAAHHVRVLAEDAEDRRARR